jgi:hypothetical protein
MPLSTPAHAAPDLADTAFRDRPNPAIAIDQSPPQDSVGGIIAEHAERQNGRTACHVIATLGQSFQRAAGVAAGRAFRKQG